MRTPLLLAALALAGCAHTDLPTREAPDFEEPFGVGEPVQLTYNTGLDRTPTWSAATGQLFYAFDKGKRIDGMITGCVGDLPVHGGSRVIELCETGLKTNNLQMRPQWPARRADGATAYVRQWWANTGFNPVTSDLVLVPPGSGMKAQSLLPIPYYAAPTATTHSGLSHPQWLADGRLIYLARVQVRSLNEDVNSGIEITILDPATGLAGITIVPGTHYASSLTLGATSDTIYYTMGGDSRVYRRALTSGVVDTVFNFDTLGIARDVQVQNGRLVAIVGGTVSFGSHPTYGMVQTDGGGLVYSVDLPSGTPVLLTNPVFRYQHLALPPGADRVITTRNGDLWGVALP